MKWNRIVSGVMAAAMLTGLMPTVPVTAAQEPLAELTLPYTAAGYKIVGNITLPETLVDGTTEIDWSSSNEAVINTEKQEFTSEEKKEYGERYEEIPAGVVMRQAKDTAVTLTAQVGTAKKEFQVTVKAKPEKTYEQMYEDGDFKGYLYASFVEPEVSAYRQQVYFASSDDGVHWDDLNRNKPVLESKLGTKATRDHYILRAPEGDRFYLIATDLDCTSGKWGDFSTKGSKYLMVWESDDLVNWSKQRMVKAADDMTGCAWAPEAIYDEVTGEYIVYWSGHDLNPDSESYNKKVVYVSRTRDFYSFSEQQKFVYPADTDGTDWGTSDSFIDTTMIQGSDGLYYRVTKYEDMPRQWNCGTKVFMDVAKYPMGEYTRVQTNLNADDFDGVEGPGWFRYNKDDAERTGYQYCLMLDGYNGKNSGVGFFPTVIEDLNGETSQSANFTKLASAQMRSWAKHGGILPLTQEEYDRVNQAYAYAPNVDLSEYINEERKVFDAADYYTKDNDFTGLQGAGWTLPSGTAFDNEDSKYLGFTGTVTMDGGYGTHKDWAAVQFIMAGNSAGDAVIRDIDGNNIFGYCYDGSGFWSGHGERSFGGTVIDQYGIPRLPGYAKTEVGPGSEEENTGRSANNQGGVCTLLFLNEENGYVVSTYINNKLISTEHYSGSFNGIREITSLNRQYYGSLKLYASETGSEPEEPVNPPVNPPVLTDDEDLLMRLTFDEEGTGSGSFGAAVGGTVTEHGSIGYANGADGTRALSITANAAGNYLELPKGILAGKSAATFSFQLKTAQTDSTASWVFMTTPLQIDEKQVFNDKDGDGEKYLGVGGVNTGRIMAERHYNTARKSILTVLDDFSVWKNVAVVYEAGGTKVYVNGSLVSSDTHQVDISQLMTAGANTWIGHANWQNGEGFSGMLDDFRIYGRALNETEIAEIHESKAIVSSDSGRLVMETVFSKNGTNVLSAAAQETVSVKTRVTNYSPTSRALAYCVTGYSADGTVTEQLQQIDGDVTVKSMKTAVFVKDITAKPETAYYQLTVKDITDAGRIQEFTAGYLPVGTALTAQMIAGTYQNADGSQMIVSADNVNGTQVTINGKTYTAALKDGTVRLTDNTGAYADKRNASATDGTLSVTVTPEPMVIDKSSGGNPIIRTDKDGNRLYGGDPAAVVIDDTVYLVVGHDNGKPGNNNANYYNMPDWQYYTSADLKTWTHGGTFMKQSDIPWRSTSNDAWASQMTPYTNKKTGETKYYFYFCTPSEGGTHAIGVAVAEEPGGPYTATSAPLVKGADTWVDGIGNAGHHDIDPTVWIDTDEEGNEHRYLMWGNTTCYIAELNEDMVSIKDRNGDGTITIDHTGSDDHDIKYIDFANTQPGQGFTEAPWLYRRQDENGNYYGKYYMFAAWGWAEKMGYATADDPFGPWTFEGMIMENTLTSNTNHPAVIDFKGKTYFIYHNGSLPGGNGGNRSVCIQEMAFRKDGSIEMMPDLSLGLGGTASVIKTSDNNYLGHDPLGNTQSYVVGVNGGGQGEYRMDVKGYGEENGYNTQWEIVPARIVPEGEDAAYYVSIQSTNMTGYFIKSESSSTKLASDNMGTMEAMMSYKTVHALDGSEGVSFESAAYPGKYLTFVDGRLVTAKPTSLSRCSFTIAEPGTPIEPAPPEDTDQAAAERVIDLIHAIGQVSNTSASRDKIQAARTAYNALTESQRKRITSAELKILTDAEEAYARLEEEAGQEEEDKRKEEAKKQQAAELNNVIQQIKLEGKEADYTAESWAAYQKALADAKAILNDPKAEAAAILQAKTELERAIQKLVRTGAGNPDETEEAKKAKAGTISIADSKKAITSANTDKKDVAGSTFKTLKVKAVGGNKSVTVSWNKIKDASGYMVYGAECGKKMKLLKTLPASKKSYKAAKLKKGKYYKYIVTAYKEIYKENRVIATSVSVHASTNGGKYKVPSGIRISKSKVSVKKGKTLTLKPGMKTKGKGSFKTHMAKFRFESSDPKVATVTKKGKVKGIKKGKSCYIYIYAQNGVYKQVKVTVK